MSSLSPSSSSSSSSSSTAAAIVGDEMVVVESSSRHHQALSSAAAAVNDDPVDADDMTPPPPPTLPPPQPPQKMLLSPMKMHTVELHEEAPSQPPAAAVSSSSSLTPSVGAIRSRALLSAAAATPSNPATGPFSSSSSNKQSSGGGINITGGTAARRPTMIPPHSMYSAPVGEGLASLFAELADGDPDSGVSPGAAATSCTIDSGDLLAFLADSGFTETDPRFKSTYHIARHPPQPPQQSLLQQQPAPLLSSSASIASSSISRQQKKRQRRLTYLGMAQALGSTVPLVEASVKGELAIPDFASFRESVREIFEIIQSKDFGGSVASYIPQLAAVDPTKFALSFCSVDGQRFSFGDSDVDFCVQSCCKPIQYCIALEEVGPTKVHQHIGREPSGRSFNHMSLLDKRPHNPMINAGAIMSCALIQRGKPLYSRFDHVLKTWGKLYGGSKVSFNNSVYLSERDTADRNFALGYMMKEAGAFPPDTDLTDALEFYFQCCSLEGTTDKMATLAATMANGGICPLTGEHVFEPSNVRNCLSLMASCGMYDYSGEWNFNVGLPAKSGVSGAIWVVVPQVGGFCCWSPRIDSFGNSKKAVELFRALSERFTFHLLEPRRLRALKIDPTDRRGKHQYHHQAPQSQQQEEARNSDGQHSGRVSPTLSAYARGRSADSSIAVMPPAAFSRSASQPPSTSSSATTSTSIPNSAYETQPKLPSMTPPFSPAAEPEQSMNIASSSASVRLADDEFVDADDEASDQRFSVNGGDGAMKTLGAMGRSFSLDDENTRSSRTRKSMSASKADGGVGKTRGNLRQWLSTISQRL